MRSGKVYRTHGIRDLPGGGQCPAGASEYIPYTQQDGEKKRK
jgi:hypothetical protein